MLYVLVSIRNVDSLVLYKLMYILSEFLKLYATAPFPLS